MCICYAWLSLEHSENPTQLPKMLTHLVIVFTALCLCSWLHTTLWLLWTHVLEPTDLPRVLGLNFLQFLNFRVSLLTDQHPLSFSFILAGFHRHFSLCGLHTKIDKGVPLDTLMPVKNVEDKIPSLATHPLNIYTSKYIYTYIYTHTHTHTYTLMLNIMPHLA